MTSGYWGLLASILCVFMAIASTQTVYPVGDVFTSEISPEFTVSFKFDREDEVKKQCDSVLSSAVEFRLDRNKIYEIKDELLFMNGDWGQEVGNNPLLPYDNTGVGNYSSPSNLVSFWVSDVRSDHQSKKYAAINGILALGVTVDGMLIDKNFANRPHFQIWPGHSELSIFFQGFYAESEIHRGERVMCLLGNTLLPSREPDSTDQWVKNSGSDQNQPSVSEDDHILLVLRYPMIFTLTNREIKGKMTSLNPKSNPKYFDEVTISSQLTRTDNYEFSSEKIVSKACDPYPYPDKFFPNISTYHGGSFCQILEEITRDQAFSVLPNWRCNKTDDICRKMGPFGSNHEINETDGGFKDVKLSMQNVKCEHFPESVNSARVSAVFRAVSPKENLYTVEKRSGLSNMSMAAEGIWKSSNGQLCMIGCLGIVDSEGRGCNSRICMYIPTYFSIKQRSIIMGTISAMDDDQSYFALSFEKLVQPSQLWNYFQDSHPHYEYTKSTAAGVILEKNQAFTFGDVIKKSLLQYPKLEDSESYEVSLSLLSEDLSLHVSASQQQSEANTFTTDLNLEIVSIGPLFSRYWSNSSFTNEDTPYHGKAEYTEKQLLLNVSAQLLLFGGDFNNFSTLFLEGLYDPHVGKMFLVGCRDVRTSWNVLFESGDLEDGLDCSIEVVVSYPPTTARWLVNPIASITISSRRTKDDPLYFQAIKLETLPVMYRKQREDILSRRGVEGILRMLTLSVAIACITSQIFYIRHNVDSVPYMSLVMLGVQVLGYSLPLVTGVEALFKRAASNSYEMQSYDLNQTLWYRLIEYGVKLIIMISLLLTLRLCQKVWRSRIRLLSRAPLEPGRVPSDKRVLITTFLTHLVGYILILFVHGSMSSKKLFRVKSYLISRRKYRMMQGWETELEEYSGLVQDFFLFPQVIGNLLWQIDGKPLRKLYFVGITLVRLLPHFYDYLRAPSLNPYFAEEYEFVDPKLDYFSKFGDIAIPLTAFLLAVIVYIQQRWKYEKLSRALTLGRFRLLPMASRMYERLPSVPVESELSSGVSGKLTTHNGNHSDLE